MAWEAIRLDRELSAAELVDALVAVLRVPAADIAIGEQLEEVRPDATVMAALRIEGSGFEGEGGGGADGEEFNTIVDVVAKDDELGRPLDAAAVAAICAHLKCRALVDDDDGDNPYCFLLVTADSPIQPVLIDQPAFDERNILTIARPATEEDRRARPEGPISQRRPTPPPPASTD